MVLLGKLLQKIGGFAEPGDTAHDLLSRILTIFNSGGGGGGGGAAVWGDITGTLSNQADLQAALNAKQNVSTVKVYRAILTQTGTNAPVATVLENSLGGTPVWSYVNVGFYALTLAAAFPAAKTLVKVGSAWDVSGIADTNTSFTFNARPVSDSVWYFQTTYQNGSDGIGAAANELLSQTAIEILVYP